MSELIPKERVLPKKLIVQKLYLEVMQRIGELERMNPPDESKQALLQASLLMVRAKREWIGDTNEIDAEWSVPVAVEQRTG